MLLAMGGESRADEPAANPVEAEHLKIVSEFCAAWSTLNADKLAGYLSDKIVYQIIDNLPLVKGKEAFVKFVTPFLATVERAQWDTSRSHCIGNLVINQRVDNFYFKGKKPAAHYQVAGFFIVREGKIVEWKDYRLPKEAAAPKASKSS
jgi:limonene-1,2-epoxide hydrolase